MQLPHGMLLLQAPRVPGAKLRHCKCGLIENTDRHDKIVTIEDPVEYQLPGVLQIPATKKGLRPSHADCGLFPLRHDPDKIMAGEPEIAKPLENRWFNPF